MLQTVSTIEGYPVDARDGRIGRIDDVYFNDRTGEILYFAVDTHTLLSRSPVLLYAGIFESPDRNTQRVSVDTTMEKVKNSPPFESAEPVSRRYEKALFEHFEWPFYWDTVPEPAAAEATKEAVDEVNEAVSREEWHLRSARELTGYAVSLRDRPDAGKISDLVMDGDWNTVLYSVVKSPELLTGLKVLLPLSWVSSIDFGKKSVSFAVTAKTMQKAPPYEPSKFGSGGYASSLLDHFAEKFSHLMGM